MEERRPRASPIASPKATKRMTADASASAEKTKVEKTQPSPSCRPETRFEQHKSRISIVETITKKIGKKRSVSSTQNDPTEDSMASKHLPRPKLGNKTDILEEQERAIDDFPSSEDPTLRMAK
ncbi:unnamed protein product, partial [Mesorhabditis spiculigera]